MVVVDEEGVGGGVVVVVRGGGPWWSVASDGPWLVASGGGPCWWRWHNRLIHNDLLLTQNHPGTHNPPVHLRRRLACLVAACSCFGFLGRRLLNIPILLLDLLSAPGPVFVATRVATTLLLILAFLALRLLRKLLLLDCWGGWCRYGRVEGIGD